MADTCGTCGKPENFPEDSKSELRPYGPSGAFICYRCAFETPETAERTKAAFDALLDASSAISPTGVVAIGESSGPRPFDPNEARDGAS